MRRVRGAIDALDGDGDGDGDGDVEEAEARGELYGGGDGGVGGCDAVDGGGEAAEEGVGLAGAGVPVVIILVIVHRGCYGRAAHGGGGGDGTSCGARTVRADDTVAGAAGGGGALLQRSNFRGSRRGGHLCSWVSAVCCGFYGLVIARHGGPKPILQKGQKSPSSQPRTPVTARARRPRPFIAAKANCCEEANVPPRTPVTARARRLPLSAG